MAEIGRKGGETVSRDRRHMAEIGREGGEHAQSGRKTRTA
jgi:general stress protein YciG